MFGVNDKKLAVQTQGQIYYFSASSEEILLDLMILIKSLFEISETLSNLSLYLK